jgi:hypothetical protein
MLVFARTVCCSATPRHESRCTDPPLSSPDEYCYGTVPFALPGTASPSGVNGEKGAKAADTGAHRTEQCRSRLCDKGLSRDSLGGLGCSLLRLGNVRPTIFARVDPLSSPCACGEGVHDLNTKDSFQHTTTKWIIPLWRQRCSKSAQIQYLCCDLINQAKAAEVVAKLLLGRILVQATEIDITARAALADNG